MSFGEGSSLQMNAVCSSTLRRRNFGSLKTFVPDPVERDQWQVSVLVWGAIKYNQTSILEIVNGNLNAAKYLSILKRRLMRNLPDLRDSSPLDVVEDTLIFQQDNASVHTANEVKTYFQERSIYVLPWPPKSPDLNLIEEVWAWLKNGLKRSYRDVEELEEDIIYIWESIPSEFIKKLYDSMKNRIQAVIEAQGGPTDY